MTQREVVKGDNGQISPRVSEAGDYTAVVPGLHPQFLEALAARPRPAEVQVLAEHLGEAVLPYQPIIYVLYVQRRICNQASLTNESDRIARLTDICAQLASLNPYPSSGENSVQDSERFVSSLDKAFDLWEVAGVAQRVGRITFHFNSLFNHPRLTQNSAEARIIRSLIEPLFSRIVEFKLDDEQAGFLSLRVASLFYRGAERQTNMDVIQARLKEARKIIGEFRIKGGNDASVRFFEAMHAPAPEKARGQEAEDVLEVILNGIDRIIKRDSSFSDQTADPQILRRLISAAVQLTKNLDITIDDLSLLGDEEAGRQPQDRPQLLTVLDRVEVYFRSAEKTVEKKPSFKSKLLILFLKNIERILADAGYDWACVSNLERLYEIIAVTIKIAAVRDERILRGLFESFERQMSEQMAPELFDKISTQAMRKFLPQGQHTWR